MLKSFKMSQLVLMLLVFTSSSAIAQRNTQLFDDGWKFMKGQPENAHKLNSNDSLWRTVNLPHDWTIEDLEPLPAAKPSLSITEGKWRFVKGDDMAYKAGDYDDSKWQEVQLPGAWEMYADYKDYKVYGWLRRTIKIPDHLKGKDFDLAVGWIHEADQTFLNGKKIGETGSFPPDFKAASTTNRNYPVTPSMLKGDGTDVVAVRVYKNGGWGGGIFRSQRVHERSGPFDTQAFNASHLGYTVGGIGWYRKTFTPPASDKGKKTRIQFGGVYQDADVFVNGKKIGNHPYGYTSFGYDLTPHIKFGENNVIAVNVKNVGYNSRWYTGSGIYRHVWLTTTNPVHIANWGTYITTPEVSDEKAVVNVRTKVINKGSAEANVRLRIKIVDPAGRTVGSIEATSNITPNARQKFNQKLNVKSPSLWSVDSPNLYYAIQEVLVDGKVVDSTKERFGIRTISFSAKEGFKLNGKSMLLKGSCMHHDNGPLGAAAFDDAEYRRVKITKEAGFNAIRCSHNPPSVAFLDACDELGVMVIDETFDTWKHGKGGTKFYAEKFEKNWKSDTKAMVLRDRNHPSIIMWSIGNEIPQNDKDPVFETARMIADFTKRLDPTRPITSGVQGVNPKKDPFFTALDIAGYNYALKWNEGHRYKTNAYEEDHARHPDRIIVGTESFPSHAFNYWMTAVDYPYVIGDFVWTGYDYLGESSIGWIGFGYPVYWPVAYCGDISITGRRRAASYYRQALFADDDVVAAFVRCPKPSYQHVRRFDWGFDDVKKSWTWPEHVDKHLNVVVYSSCDEVELFLNDKSLGKHPTTREQRFQAGFGLKYQPGTLKAVGYKDGKAVANWTLKTASAPAAVRLLPETTTIKANGQSLAYVPFEIVDAYGVVNPNADNLVEISVDGPASVAAVGNGDPSSLESFQQPKRKAYRGEGLIILRSTNKPGTIKLTAKSNGLKAAIVNITAK